MIQDLSEFLGLSEPDYIVEILACLLIFFGVLIFFNFALNLVHKIFDI